MDSRKETTLELLVSTRHEAMSVGVRHKFYDNTDSGTWWKYNQWRAKYFNRYKLLPNTRNTWDLEIFSNAWFTGPGFDWVLQLSAGCQLVTWGSPVSGWHLILSWHPMSSCPWFVLSPVSSLITDWGLTFTSPLSLLYLDPGQLNMMNCYGSRELNTQDTRAHGSYSSRAGALLTLLSLDLNKLQASLWSCYLGLQMRFGREWGWVRGLVTSNNNHNWNVGAILVHICPK